MHAIHVELVHIYIGIISTKSIDYEDVTLLNFETL